MSKIKIITDSGSDISWEKAKELGIRMLPISFSFDGETYYRQGIDMQITNGSRPSDLYDIVEGKTIGTLFRGN